MILIVGNKGSMGQRYSAILKYLCVPFKGVDIGDKWPDFDKAIVCTPTDTHYEICKHLINIGKPFLCEKPVSKSVEECEQLRDLAKAKNIATYMVNNWVFAQKNPLDKPYHIEYNNYKTGKDGLDWDCIQLHYLSETLPTLTTNRPFFECMFDGFKITLENIEVSYIAMLEVWLEGEPFGLWNLDDAVKATKKVRLLCGS